MPAGRQILSAQPAMVLSDEPSMGLAPKIVVQAFLGVDPADGGGQ